VPHALRSGSRFRTPPMVAVRLPPTLVRGHVGYLSLPAPVRVGVFGGCGFGMKFLLLSSSLFFFFFLPRQASHRHGGHQPAFFSSHPRFWSGFSESRAYNQQSPWFANPTVRNHRHGPAAGWFSVQEAHRSPSVFGGPCIRFLEWPIFKQQLPRAPCGCGTVIALRIVPSRVLRARRDYRDF